MRSSGRNMIGQKLPEEAEEDDDDADDELLRSI